MTADGRGWETDHTEFVEDDAPTIAREPFDFERELPPAPESLPEHEPEYSGWPDATDDTPEQPPEAPVGTVPPVVPVQPAPPLQETSSGVFERHRLPIALGAAALAAALFVGGVLTGRALAAPDDPKLPPRTVPSASTIASLSTSTKEACDAPADILPRTAYTAPPNRTIVIGNDAEKVVLVSPNRSLRIADGVRVDEVYFCAQTTSLEVVGEVGTLGIDSYKADVTIDGVVDRVYMDNILDAISDSGKNTVVVNGEVGDLVFRGDKYSLNEDVFVYGQVSNALQQRRSHFPMLWNIDTRGEGVIGRIQEY